jgi:hypothetical protein
MLVGLIAVALLAAPPTSSTASHDPTFQHIRTASAHVQKLIEKTVAQSPTFAALLDEIDRTNVGVYIELVTQLPAPLRGRLHFMSASGGYRYVRVQVKANLPGHEMAASLAHELWHALEIGHDHTVRCEHTLHELYQRIGDERSERRFETTAAIAAGRQVRAEVLDN